MTLLLDREPGVGFAERPASQGEPGTTSTENDLPHRITHEQVVAHDDKGERHAIKVTRSPVPGASHLHGPPRYAWREGETLHLVDAKAGILECGLSRQRLKIEDWRG